MRYMKWTALAAGVLLAVQATSQADDTVRLGGPSAQAEIQGGTDNELVHWRGGYRGGYYGGGYRGGYYGGGYRGGYYGRSYYGGYYGRSYYGGGYYRPSYAYSYYQPYYSGYVSSYYPSYYGGCSTPIYSSSYYYPVAGDSAPTVNLQQAQSLVYRAPAPTARPNNVQPMPPAQDGNGTFPYNGGPQQVVPMPPASNVPAPMSAPRGIIPLDGKLVSLPTQTGGGVSPISGASAGGWTAVRTANVVPTGSTPIRVSYPAYGENAVPSPARTNR